MKNQNLKLNKLRSTFIKINKEEQKKVNGGSTKFCSRTVGVPCIRPYKLP